MHAPLHQLGGANYDLAGIRLAQAAWEECSPRIRRRIICKARHELVDRAEEFADELGHLAQVPPAEKLASEILPLAESCRWLERSAAKILRPHYHGRKGRPVWLGNVEYEVRRKPHGLVLVVGPGNYPLFLPAVQSIQALVAGNAVLWKPAPGTRYVATEFARILYDAGLDESLLTILPEQIQAVHHAIEAGVDKVVFTGSSTNGRDLLATLAPTNTPAVMELSGEDAVLVLADAPLDLVVRALRFGLRLNNGATCIAPRRVIVEAPLDGSLQQILTPAERDRLRITGTTSQTEMVRLANQSDYGLGAAIFSRNINNARKVAARLRTGFVTINDLIVPTADPRIPFGGTKASGFGTTRGVEGLFEMTYPHVVATRRPGRHRHFDPVRPEDTRLFAGLLGALHGTFGQRWQAIATLTAALRRRLKPTSSIA